MKKRQRSSTRQAPGKGRNPKAGKSGVRASSNVSVNAEAVHEKIRTRAYELFEQRGKVDGFDLQDWAQAENQVMMEPRIR